MLSRRRFLHGLGVVGLGPSRAAAAAPGAPEVLRDAVARGEIPGAVLHVRSGGRVVLEEGFGLSPDDLFPVMSLTKPVVAAAILQLAEAGKLRVDDPVSAYIPEFARPRVLVSHDAATGTTATRPARREITLRDLLTHTAGIHHGHAEIDPVLGAIYAKAGVAHDSRTLLADTMAKLGPLPLAHDPGARWTYGLSSDVLGRVIEVVAGTPLDRQLARAIFEPLGMRRSFLVVPPDERPRVVPRYVRDGERMREMPAPSHEATPYLSGGGGLVTTIGDYARFVQALLDGGAPILSRASVRAMTRNQIGDLRAFGFRWGFSVAVSTPNARGHVPLPAGGFGWYGIYGTWFWAMPRERAAVLCFTDVVRSDMTLPLFARVVAATS